MFSLRYAFFQRHQNYFYRRLAAIHSFNSTVYFSDAKICSHPPLLAYFLSANFRIPVTVKLPIEAANILRAALIVLK